MKNTIKNMIPKFKEGDIIQHKDKGKKEKMHLEGVVVRVCSEDERFYYLLNSALIVPVEHQDMWETTDKIEKRKNKATLPSF